MILPAIKLTEGVGSPARSIIVGSGPVGLSLARFLAANGAASLVIEAGSESANSVTQRDLELELSGPCLSGAVVGRTRQLGGGLNLWGGQLAILDAREAAPTGDAPDGWPIPTHELADRYRVAAALLGHEKAVLPPSGVFEGIDLSQLAPGDLNLIATAWLKRPKLRPAIWREIERSPLITVALDAFVDRIKVDLTSGRAVGVSALSADGQRIAFDGSCVILACGSIETARLLLQPGCDDGQQPWSNLRWLGRGFNEHLDAAVATITAINARRMLDVFDPILAEGVKYTPKLFSQIQVTERSRLSAVAMLSMPDNLRNSIVELHLLLRSLVPRHGGRLSRQIAAATVDSIREIAPLAWRYLRHKRLGTVLRGAGTLRVSVEQPVRIQSYISLSSTVRDTRGVPQAKLHWVKGEEEGRAFLGMAQRVKSWTERAGLANVEIDPRLVEDPEAFAMSADDGLHHAGGARMADTPTSGVVDPNLQVFRSLGLFCCGAATFPRSGFANPTLTAVTLGVRLGEHLIETGLAST